MISACVEGLRFLNHGSSRPPCSPKGGLLAGVSRDVWRKAPPNPRCCRILVSVVRPEVRCWTHRWAEVGHRTWSALPVLGAEVRCSQAAFYFCWNNKLPGNTLSLLFTRNTGMLQNDSSHRAGESRIPGSSWIGRPSQATGMAFVMWQIGR